MKTRSEIKAEVLFHLEAIEGELYPVYEFVAAYGEEAKAAINELWREKLVRLVPVDRKDSLTPLQIADSIEGATYEETGYTEVLAYVRTQPTFEF